MKKREEQPVVREQRVTYDDYARMPDDGQRYELSDGVLELMSPAPSPKHQVIGSTMQHFLLNNCQSDYFIINAPVDLILSPTEVRQPDLLAIHRSRAGMITKRGIEGIPDLVVEILSPHSLKRDKHHKLTVYARYGIPEYWIVDPANEALEQYALTELGHYTLGALYDREDTVTSERLPCAAFTMGEIVDAAAGLPG